MEEAAKVVLSVLPHLESLSIGGTDPKIIRHEGGEISFEWPWTGRMKEWTYDVVPERPDVEDEL